MSLYEEHAQDIIEICPTIKELENPTQEQRKCLRALQLHCFSWCVQEWEWAYKTAKKILTQEKL